MNGQTGYCTGCGAELHWVETSRIRRYNPENGCPYERIEERLECPVLSEQPWRTWFLSLHQQPYHPDFCSSERLPVTRTIFEVL